MRGSTPTPTPTGQAVLYRERNASRPFLLEVAQDVRGLGVRCYAVPRRYAAAPLAEHLIGYLDGEGRGAAGLEAALDDILSTGGQDILRCAVTAQGRLRRGSEPVLEKASAAARGVRLTLSRSIQRAAEGVAAESMATGCILILEAGSGKVRACVSRPGFDPAHVAASLTAPDSPLLNRALSGLCGRARCSSRWWRPQRWKPGRTGLVSGTARAIDSREWTGLSAAPEVCPHGEVELGGRAGKELQRLLYPSWGRSLGPERVREMAGGAGLRAGRRTSRRTPLSLGWRSAARGGDARQPEGQFANFCFGQGELSGDALTGGRDDEHHCGGRRLPHPSFRGVHRGRDDRRGARDRTGPRLVPGGCSLNRRHGALRGAAGRRRGGGHGPAGGPLREGTAAGKTGTAQTGQFRGGRRAEKLLVRGLLPGGQAHAGPSW